MQSLYSDIIQGLWRMDQWGNTAQENLGLIEGALDLGVTTFDQAHVYGWQPSSEEVMGQALAQNPLVRNRMKIITKYNICAHGLPEGQVKHYDTSFEAAIQSVNLSLARMGVEYIDLLLIHRADFLMNADEVAKAFNKLRFDGKVLSFGVSNFSPSQYSLLQSRLDFPLVTNQVELNPLRFGCLGDGTLDQCQEKRVRPMAWSPLAGGELFTEGERPERVRRALEEVAQEHEVTMDQVAVAWVRRHPSEPHVIVGTGQLERVRSAVEATKIELTREQWYRIWTASMGSEVP